VGPVTLAPARTLWTCFEPLHAVTYFTAEAREAFEAVGLRGFWRGYFAGRAAPLGRVDAAPVTALFAGFKHEMVARAIPEVWSLASPEAVLRARQGGAVAALRGVLVDEEAVALAAAPLQEAAARATWSGLALGGANAALPWPDDPYAVLFQAATVLREHRGDAHVAAQVVAGLSGLEAMVLRSLQDIERELLQPARGWSDEEWDAATAALVERGLVAAGAVTPAGQALLADVERRTDEIAFQPWRTAGASVADAFLDAVSPLVELVVPLLPAKTPIGIPGRG